MNRSLYDSNLDVIKEKEADGRRLAARFRNFRPTDFSLVGEAEAGTLNLVRAGVPFYQPDALTSAAVQVDEYLQSPERYMLDRPSARQDPGTVHSDFRKALYGALDGWELSAEPSSDAGYLVSFGAGSGIAALLLLDRLDVRNLVLVETDPDRLWACLNILPFDGLFQKLEARGGTVRIILEEDPEAAANWALQALRGVDHTLVDGSYIFRERDGDDLIDQAGDHFRVNLTTLAASMGFFEDECLMFANTVANLKRHHFRLMGPSAVSPKTIPALIVGSGPSIDQSIDSIQRNADKTIVISGGTAITIMKRNGIEPDFHTQFENVAMNVDVLEAIEEEVGLKNTILIAPTTVDPRIPGLFKETIFYFRDSLCPTKLFVEMADMVPLSGPTVTNLACRAGISFGITEFLLYGIDLGGPNPETHHSKDSIYEYSKNRMLEATGQTMQEVALADPQNIPVAGNRRDRVYTSRIMILARMFFEKLFTSSNHLKVYNCSDGVRILGTQPVDPKAVNITAGLVEKDVLKKAILDEMPAYEPGAIVSDERIDEFGARLREIFATLKTILARHKARANADADVVFREMYDEIRPLLQQGQEELAHGTDAAARVVANGTVIMIVQTGHFLLRRLDGANQKTHFLEIFCDCFIDVIARMEDELTALLEKALK
ncbi:motility associated factor glycosyltransferase family protein [Aestuariispira insulae]|uniref:Uncharacterized protein DUF115 n=1 Tax=Aestuariispira insulae TaxID=1461337 RepID=A0A3D9HX73_9PROT|nr:6-hydroxymethylpterin diphosphokinase MptE-like protein [Aestuariispira insulae]RED54097.1 uncharacterized protein DUF115 [Aestuariispira insulae]